MGKPTGFLELGREVATKRPRDERVRDYAEIEGALSDEALSAQASRCMDCGVPFCHAACPLENLIPEWNDLVYRGRTDEARRRLEATNNFPEFTGRLCPAPCEAACVLSINAEPVTIKQVELHIAEGLRKEGLVPRPALVRSGKRVAIVGSGPAGLACAQELARAGHDVTVFEKADRPGGLLRYGIPDFKMEKQLLDDRIAQIEAEGVVFACGRDVGVAPSAQELRSTFDVVVLAIGAERPRVLDIEGANLEGVVLALDYLTQQNRVVAGDEVRAPRLTAEGKDVIILGGGDTGADCLGTAHRQGARSVIQIEIADRPGEKRPLDNPWPLWPKTFRISPAHDEGGERLFSLMTTRLEGEGGQVKRLVAARVEHTPNGLAPVVGSETSFPAELVLVAAGFLGPAPSALLSELGVELDAHGRLAASLQGETSVPGVLAIGDARVGASLIVTAIAEGRRAARKIDALFSGRHALPVLASPG